MIEAQIAKRTVLQERLDWPAEQYAITKGVSPHDFIYAPPPPSALNDDDDDA
jgi:hypothetical protein